MATNDPGPGRALDAALGSALDGLLSALVLERLHDDRFRATHEPPRFPRIFGGQLLAQSLVAAQATVPSLPASSLHAYFVRSGELSQPLDLEVERVRDGRTMATRRVTITQGERTVLVAMASFHQSAAAPDVTPTAPEAPGPDELPTLQDWARTACDRGIPGADVWIEVPPPLDVRVGEAFTFLGGGRATGTRAHWLRVPRELDGDERLHTALFTYASDYFLSDMAIRSSPSSGDWTGATSSTADHAVWLHRPVRFDRWHLYVLDTVALVGHRALVRGSLHDERGALVATTAQEVVVPPGASAADR